MNRLEHEEAFDLLDTLKNDSIDLICIDPPYEINYRNLSWDVVNIEWCVLIREFYRLLRSTGNVIVFQGWSNVNTVINLFETDKGNWTLNNWIIWDRQKTKNGGNKNFTSAREDILWFTKTEDYTFNKEDSTIEKKTKGFGSKNGSKYRRLSNVWTDISPVMYTMEEYNGYPTQKPLELMKRIIRVFSNPDDIVLDCFCGSGSTLEAAAIEGRKYIGFDINEEAIDIANKRLKKYKNGNKICD